MVELREANTGAVSGTKMRNIAQRLGQFKDDTKASEALSELGLTWQEVDGLNGETMPAALKKIGQAVHAKPIEERNSLMGKLFNNENVAAADVLINNIDAASANVAKMDNQEVFLSGVNFSLSGASADTRRSAVREQRETMKNAEIINRREWITRKENESYEEQWNRVERSNLDGGEKAAVKAMLFTKRKAMQTSDLMFEKEDYYGNNPAVNNVIDASMGYNMTSEDLKRRLAPAADPQAAAMAEQNAHLRTIAEAVTNPANKPVVNPNATGRTDK